MDDIVIRHGGAVGFDQQVAQWAEAHGYNQRVYAPDYATYGKRAPLVRNQQLLDGADLLIACYDGRSYGGTKATIDFARKMPDCDILILRPPREGGA